MTRLVFSIVCILMLCPAAVSAEEQNAPVFDAERLAKIEPQAGPADRAWEPALDLSDKWELHFDGGAPAYTRSGASASRDEKFFSAGHEAPPVFFGVGVHYNF